MKAHKKRLFRRVSNEIAKAVSGCTSMDCVFHDEDEVRPASSHPCRCKETLRDLAKQLTKETETI